MFDLETALATWRRTLETQRTFTAEDVEELEHHIRDEVHGYLLEGLSEEAAFHRAVREMGQHGVTTEEYRKQYSVQLAAPIRQPSSGSRPAGAPAAHPRRLSLTLPWA